MKLLERFKKDFFNIVEKIKFQENNCKFQHKINSDIKDIISLRKTLTLVDKISNFFLKNQREILATSP